MFDLLVFFSAYFVSAHELCSTEMSFDSLWWRSTEIVRASRRVLMLLRIAPDMGTVKWSSYMAGMLGAMTDTTWPLLMPSNAIDEATWRHRR